MEIGMIIKQLRIENNITQEDLANELNVSIQTISRWENSVNCPDLSMVPLIALLFGVTTDYLLGVEKRTKSMRKLLKTVETFELETREEAEDMANGFKRSKFPILKDYSISETDGKIILEATKEFNTDVDKMKFN